MDGRLREIRALLAGFGLTDEQQDRFLDRLPVTYATRTASRLWVAMIGLVGDRLRHGIVEIEDPGNGFRSFNEFRGRSLDLARNLGVDEVELFGAAVINPKLKAVLTRSGFVARPEAIPDDLGDDLKAELGADGVMEILTRTFRVPAATLRATG